MAPHGLAKLNPWHKIPAPEKAEGTAPSSPPPAPSKSATDETSPQDRLPKHRPPRLLRDKLTASLPRYTGPYAVGVLELEIPVPQPRSISRLSRNGEPILQLRTVLFNIYYPAEIGTGEHKHRHRHHVHMHHRHGDATADEKGHEEGKERKEHGRPRWLSAPVKQIGKGYASYSEMPAWLTTAWFGGLTGLTRLPAWRNAQIADHVPSAIDFAAGGSSSSKGSKKSKKASAEAKGNSSGSSTPNGIGASPETNGTANGSEGSGRTRFPLIMFSHGLGGTRTTYSSVCGEFASYGYVVCAVEHRDGSGPLTFVNYENELQKNRAEAKAKARAAKAAKTNGSASNRHSQGSMNDRRSSRSPPSPGPSPAATPPFAPADRNGSIDSTAHQSGDKKVKLKPAKEAMEQLFHGLSRQQTMYDLCRSSSLPPGSGEDTVTYVWPKHPHDDTKEDQEVDMGLRRAQVEMRKMEIKEAIHIISQINSGNAEAVLYKNKRNKHRTNKRGTGQYSIDDIDWEKWKGRIDMSRITMAGHSFGAVTAIEVLRYRQTISPCISQGIIYDPWGASIIKHTNVLRDHTVDVPLLCVNSECFMHWESNFADVVPVIEESLANGCDAYMCTIRGSIHINQSDFALLYPRTCSLLLKMTVDPRRCVDINHCVSMEFLRRVEKERISKAFVAGIPVSSDGGSRPNTGRLSNRPPQLKLTVPQRMWKAKNGEDDEDLFLDLPITGKEEVDATTATAADVVATSETATVTTATDGTASPEPSQRLKNRTSASSSKLREPTPATTQKLNKRASTLETLELSIRHKSKIRKITHAKNKGSEFLSKRRKLHVIHNVSRHVPEHIYNTKKKGGRFVGTNEVWMHINPELKKHAWKEDHGGVIGRVVKVGWEAVGEVREDVLERLYRSKAAQGNGNGGPNNSTSSLPVIGEHTQANGTTNGGGGGRISPERKQDGNGNGKDSGKRHSGGGPVKKVKENMKGTMVKTDGEILKVAMRSREVAAGDGYVALLPDVGIKVEPEGNTQTA